MIDQRDIELLVDRNEIAHLLGVGPTAVSNYVARTNVKHPPFPDAVLSRSFGRFRLWNLDDIMDWHTTVFPQRKSLWSNTIPRLRKYRKTTS